MTPLPFPIPPSAIATRALSYMPSRPLMAGLDVIALQRGLSSWLTSRSQAGLATDGIFGKATDAAVLRFQSMHGLTQDGVAGQKTQFAVCQHPCRVAESRFGLPPGILQGLVYNESLGWLGAVNDSVAGGKDLSAFQRRVYTADIGNWDIVGPAYSVDVQAARAADAFSKVVAATSPPTNVGLAQFGVHTSTRGRWEIAVLSHNYPAGAGHLANGETAWRFIERDIQRYSDDRAVTLSDGSRGVSRGTWRPAKWVQDASGGRLIYVHQWTSEYIQKATQFVVWG